MLADFMTGAIAMGLAVAGCFFLRYWRESRDRFFGFFALAFFALAVNRALLVFAHASQENALAPYVVRLLAFAIILVAILDKNLRRT